MWSRFRFKMIKKKGYFWTEITFSMFIQKPHLSDHTISDEDKVALFSFFKIMLSWIQVGRKQYCSVQWAVRLTAL